MAAAFQPRHEVLFDGIDLGPKRARNRFYSVPYTTGFGMHQLEREAAHRAVRAEGGWAVVSTGECVFSAEGHAGAFHTLELMNGEDERRLAPVASAIKEHGALAALELVHNGGVANPLSERVVPLAPSQVQSDALYFSDAVAKAMDLDDIGRVRGQWATAAGRARAAGFDIVYVHVAHSSLPMQFLAPYYNRRADGYGGGLHNRARFMLEVLEAVRERLQGDTVLAVRFGVEAFGTGGIGIDEALEVMRLADPLVDLWDMAVGGLANAERDLTPSPLFDEGASLPWERRAREATSKPIVASSRLTDPDLMVSLVNSGDVDLIGAARPGIADPFLPRKIRAGLYGAIRECVGANECAKRQINAGGLYCIQNATAGEEHRRGWHPERFEQARNGDIPVLVVGAGPAGMECALVLARRGFQHVHLVDAHRQMGGHTAWFSRLPGYAAWGRIGEHRAEMTRQIPGFQHVPGKRLCCDEVLDYGAEYVVVATGAVWSTQPKSFIDQEPIPGADASLAHILTPEQLLVEGVELPDRCRLVLYDCEGDLLALGIARWLQERGHYVTFVSPFSEIGRLAVHDNTCFALRGELLAGGGVLRPGLVLASAGQGGAVFLDEAATEVEVPYDAMVMLTVRESNDRLYHELLSAPDTLAEAGVRAVWRAGDCAAPRRTADALFDGHRVGRTIGDKEESWAL